MKTLAIRVSDEDHALFVAVAGREDMPLSTLVRRQLRALAREHGLLKDAPPTAAEPAAPQPPTLRAPVIESGPHAGKIDAFAFGAVLSKQVQAGETIERLAAAYGHSAQDLRERVKWYDQQVALRLEDEANNHPPIDIRGAPGKPIPMDDIFDEAPAPAYPEPEDNPPPDWDHATDTTAKEA